LGGLDILKLTKTPLTVFHVSIWGLGTLFGGAKPTKAPRGDGTAFNGDLTGWGSIHISFEPQLCGAIYCSQTSSPRASN